MLESSSQHGFSYLLMDWKFKYHLLLSRLYCSEGLYESALSCLKEAEEAFFPNPIPDWISIDGMRARIAYAQGDEAFFSNWVNHHSYLSSDDFLDSASTKIPFMQVFDTTTFIYHQIHHNRLEGLHSIIQALSDAAAAQNLNGDLIDSFLLQALLAHKTGDDTLCISEVREAMMLGMKEDYILPFYELKSEFAAVYKTLSTDLTVSEFARKLISRVITPEPHSTDRIKELANQKLIEPLTTRELEILNLVVSGYSNQDICKQLFLALSTVKGYNQSIFEKLQVSRRTEAVAKARELGIV